MRRATAIVTAVVVLVGSDAAAVAQVAPRQQLALSLDAGPAPEQPDPLTPQSRDEQPRRAPAPARLLPETEPTAADAAIVAAVRQRLADAQSAGERGSQGEREDKAALVAFFAAEKARPLWTEAAGSKPRLSSESDTNCAARSPASSRHRISRGSKTFHFCAG